MNKERDCGFSVPEGWFRLRACAIIIENNAVLVAKNVHAPYYYSVGGGVHLHETVETAVLREVFEETGEHYEIDRLVFIHENFFVGSIDNIGQKCHEVAFYYLMKSKGINEFSHESLSLNGIKETVCLLPIDELHKYTVYPAFYKEKLKKLPKNVEHIISCEYD